MKFNLSFVLLFLIIKSFLALPRGGAPNIVFIVADDLGERAAVCPPRRHAGNTHTPPPNPFYRLQ
jgi:hypothetical protein